MTGWIEKNPVTRDEDEVEWEGIVAEEATGGK